MKGPIILYTVRYQITGEPGDYQCANGPYDYWLNAIAERNRFFKKHSWVSACWITKGFKPRGKRLSR